MYSKPTMEIITTKSQSMERFITWEEIKERIKDVKSIIKDSKTYGIPRGGQYISAMLNPVNTPEEADYIVDDLLDSGETIKRWQKAYPNKDYIPLFNKQTEEEFTDKWLVFPWEVKEEPVKDNIIRICQYYGLKTVTSMEQLIQEYENR